jgi:hypothetical protein
VFVVHNHYSDKRTERIVKEIRKQAK